jgi:hypothetical protein
MEISGGGSRVGWLIPGRPGLGRNWSRLTGDGSEEAVADTTTPQPTSCRVGNKAKPPARLPSSSSLVWEMQLLYFLPPVLPCEFSFLHFFYFLPFK